MKRVIEKGTPYSTLAFAKLLEVGIHRKEGLGRNAQPIRNGLFGFRISHSVQRGWVVARDEGTQTSGLSKAEKRAVAVTKIAPCVIFVNLSRSFFTATCIWYFVAALFSLRVRSHEVSNDVQMVTCEGRGRGMRRDFPTLISSLVLHS